MTKRTTAIALLIALFIVAAATGACRLADEPAANRDAAAVEAADAPVLIITRKKRELEDLQAELTALHHQGYRIAGTTTSTAGGLMIIILQKNPKPQSP